MEFQAPQYIRLHATPKVDFQRFEDAHRDLSDLAHQVVQAMSSGQPKDVVLANLDVLFGWMCRHFYEVERLMTLIGMPDLPKHQERHNRLARQLVRFSAECRLSMVDAVFAEQFLGDWLDEHILESDLCSHATQGHLSC